MRRPSPRVLAAAFAIVVPLAPSASAQGDNGFLRGDGHTDVALTYGQEQFKYFWVGTDRMKDAGIGHVFRESYNLWVAHGLRDDLDVVVAAAIVHAETDKGTTGFRDYSSLGDSTIGVKWRVFDQRLGPGALSILAAPGFKIPLSHYEANAVTALGDGQVDARGRVVAQYGCDCGAYVALETGYDLRFSGTPDETPVHLSIGTTLFKNLTIAPFYSYVNSFGHNDIGESDFPNVEEDYERAGVNFYLRFNDRVGATLGFKTTLNGRNTGDSWGYSWGFVFRL